MPDVAAQSPIQWVDLNQFWSGIHSNWYGEDGQPILIRGRFGNPIVVDGAAQEETYGCIGPLSGGLVPGPRLVRSYEEPLFSYEETPTNMLVTGFQCISPVRYDGAANQAYNSDFAAAAGTPPDILVATFSSYTLDGSLNVSARASVVLYKFHLNPVQSVMLGTVSALTGATTRGHGWGSTAVGRSAPSGQAATVPGNIQIASLLAVSPTAGTVVLYPNNLAKAHSEPEVSPLAFDGVFKIHDFHNQGTEPLAVSPVIVHQGRLLFLGAGNPITPGFSNLTRIGASSIISAPERVVYLGVNDWYSTSAYKSTVFVEDSPFGIGALVSVNASELLAIKQNGGGYVVRGDLDNPTVIHLPSLAPTGIARNVPVACPIGVVYGSNRGVWVWTGSDVSQDLAPQLDGWFWKPSDDADSLSGEMGSFAYSHPFVFAPNNWIYDTRTETWWRYGNPNVRRYAWNSPSASGQMLCAPLVIDSTNSVLCDWFDPTQGASFYHYLSHPLQRTKGSMCRFRRIRITIQGNGTVDVTLKGIDGEPITETFEVTDDTVTASFARGIDITGQDITVQIDARSSEVGSPAPTVWRASFGMVEAEGIDDAS